MSVISRVLGVAFSLSLLGAGVASAAGPSVESTPVPVAARPDFSSMKFLVGTWTCSDLSSRRPGPFTTTEVYKMGPGTYWMTRDSVIHTASWIPQAIHSQTRYTYDSEAKLWVRITTGERGLYDVATAPNPVDATKTYTYVIQSKAPDIASYAPEVFTKVSDTKKTMATSFTETSGRVVQVRQTCNKQP